MLMYGDATAADFFVDMSNTMVYNFSSLAERYNRARISLIPPNSLGANTEEDFHVRYINWIFTNKNVFMDFMRIIMDLYNGLDVFLVITHENWSDSILESLLMLIQQRYGISAVYVNDLEDLMYAEDTGFSPFLIINLDQDREAYAQVMAENGDYGDGKDAAEEIYGGPVAPEPVRLEGLM